MGGGIKQLVFTCRLLIIVQFLCIFIASAQADLPPGTILKSASEYDYPPFALVKPDGSADGFSVELLKAVAGTMGLEVRFTTGPWYKIMHRLIDGKLDVLPLVSYSPERDKVLDFTVLYLRMRGAVFIRKGETAIRSREDLRGKEILVMRGDTAHEYALNNNLTDKLILTTTFSEAMQMLAGGKHDAVIGQQLMGLQLLKQLDISNIECMNNSKELSLKPHAGTLDDFEQKFCFAVQEDNTELLAQLNEGLAVVFADGTYDRLYNKWFGPILPASPASVTRIIKYILILLTPVVFLLALGGVWYLNRMVTEKTRRLSEEKTKAQKSAQELRESEEKYRSMMESINECTYICSPDYRISYMNSAMIKRIGRDATGEPCYKVMNAMEMKCPWCVQDKIQQGNSCSLDVVSPLDDRIYHISNSPIYHADGTISKMTIYTDITERKNAEAALRRSLEEKEVLLREIHHRVKNNLQFVSSILRLQERNVSSKEQREIFKNCQDRIQSMSLIHEILYRSGDLAKIDFPEYVRRLMNSMNRSYNVDVKKINTTLHIDNIPIGLDCAIPCGLIINELVSNALKYAFPDDGSGTIKIVLQSHGAGEAELTVSDNGVGIPGEMDIENTDSLGLKIVALLAEHQMDGHLALLREKGTTFVIRFKTG